MKLMHYCFIPKRFAHLFSKYTGIRYVLDTGTKLPSQPRKRAETVLRLSSLGLRNMSIQVSALTDEEKVLHCLNTLTAEQMRQDKKISFRLSELLCKHREANGMFVTLKDLELIKKIGPRSLKNICKQLAMEDNSPSKELIKNEDTLRQFITPELTPSFIESISTVTSMEVCIDSVCYLTMSRDMHVVEWNHINLQGSNQQKQVPSQILDQAYHVLDHLPKSSIVLMENRITRKITPLYLQYIFFIGRLQMALQTLINEDLRTSGQHKVFHIKDSFLIKTFDLRVGSERVSGQNIMRDVQNDQSSQNVSVASKFWHRYNRLESDILRERYASCFLLSLAFCQNIFLNKPVGKQINSLREIENRQLSDLAEST